MDDGNDKAIACIGWGSLVHSPGHLPIRGEWRYDGPFLPLEFARESGGKRITLVLCPGMPRVRTCWILLDVPGIEIAKQNLGLREYRDATPKWIRENIGYWDRATGTTFGLEAETIAAWAKELGLTGVVWTDLPCKFNHTNGVMPTAEQVIAYLRALDGEDRQKAEEYIRKAPAQIDTAYRRLIAQELDWTFRP
jgi:hypothetical protein